MTEKCTGGIVIGYDFRLRHSDKKTPDNQAEIDRLRLLVAELKEDAKFWFSFEPDDILKSTTTALFVSKVNAHRSLMSKVDEVMK